MKKEQRVSGAQAGRRASRKSIAALGTKSAPPVPARPANTILYVHGVANKPPESVLRCQWDMALLGFGLGERSRMAYWCQYDRHGPPTNDTCAVPDSLRASSIGRGANAARALETNRSLQEVIAAIGSTEAERRALARIANELMARANESTSTPRTRSVHAPHDRSAPGVPAAPASLARWMAALFLEDARDFLFDDARRRRMLDVVHGRLASGGGPFVVVGHGLGALIAYAALMQCDARAAEVSLFVTLGAPLGAKTIGERTRQLLKLPRNEPLSTPACVSRWINYFDTRDPIAMRRGLSEALGRSVRVEDVIVTNPDTRYDPHSATGYLSLQPIRHEVRDALDRQRFQPVAPFSLAPDALRDFEQRPAGERRPLLIELTDPAWARARLDALTLESDDSTAATFANVVVPRTTAEMASALKRVVREIVDAVGSNVTEQELAWQTMRRYMSVRLTRAEAERLAASPTFTGGGARPFYRIWRNAKKVALVHTSIHTLQVSAAHRSYDSLGHGIEVAVLDSGCSAHPHFGAEARSTIAASWDCTLQSDAPIADGDVHEGGVGDVRDAYGHGTHVAGIIAGEHAIQRRDGSTLKLTGMAPRARLHVYKVLDATGAGDDGWIIKALDHIAEVNERAGSTRISVVNLSLGGPFEQAVFGCGYTPLCEELRRLWRLGVLVVISAGNEGYVQLMSNDGELGVNLPFSIGDPANLEEAIVVGAVHKEKPFSYGVSHFSSRGPTADGRAKPDCVAPGEQILSCRHTFRSGQFSERELYVPMDGTSMAAPHVSGLLACFLSRRREFIGSPDRVKRILLDSCTDLGRDRLLQGAGMPNLVRMLLST